MLNKNINKNNTTTIYLIEYENKLENVYGINQLKEFIKYRIEVNIENNIDNNIDKILFNDLTEEICLNILKIDGYNIKIFEIY